MNKIETFQQFLTTQNIPIPVGEFILNLFLAAIFSFILSKMYIKFGVSISNRQIFAKNFMLLTLTTLLVITIVKTSLALSLGLVGALSIVRFRAPIKEPEELTYLFLAIAIGLGLGANQRLITLTAFILICIFILIKNYSSKADNNQNMLITVSCGQSPKLELEQIVKVLKKYCAMVNLKRFDETKDVIEASFMVRFDEVKNLNETRAELNRLDDSMKITFLDNNGII